MGIINAVMVPHPPIIIPGVGRGEERKIQATTDAYFEAAGLVAGARPDTIVITTPHGTVYADWFHISPGAGVRGSFAAFGEDTPIAVSYDEEFVRELAGLARSAGFPAGTEGERSRRLTTVRWCRFISSEMLMAAQAPAGRSDKYIRPVFCRALPARDAD